MIYDNWFDTYILFGRENDIGILTISSPKIEKMSIFYSWHLLKMTFFFLLIFFRKQIFFQLFFGLGVGRFLKIVITMCYSVFFFLHKQQVICIFGSEHIFVYFWSLTNSLICLFYKASGKLESFIEKRRRRNASKDHRYMPYRRSGNIE